MRSLFSQVQDKQNMKTAFNDKKQAKRTDSESGEAMKTKDDRRTEPQTIKSKE
jgi:hypothetical protein